MVLIKLKPNQERSFEVCVAAGYKHQITRTVTPCPLELASYLWVHRREKYDFVPQTNDEHAVFCDYPEPLMEDLIVEPVVEASKHIKKNKKKKKKKRGASNL